MVILTILPLSVLVYANRAQRHPNGLCQYSYYIFFYFWETSSKAPRRAHCQYSYFLHLFSLFLFAYTMNTHIQWYCFIPLDIIIFYSKIPISLFCKVVQNSNIFLDVNGFSSISQDNLILISFVGQLWC